MNWGAKPPPGNSSHYEPLNFSVMGDSYQKLKKPIPGASETNAPSHRKVVWGDFSAEKRSTSRMLQHLREYIIVPSMLSRKFRYIWWVNSKVFGMIRNPPKTDEKPTGEALECSYRFGLETYCYCFSMWQYSQGSTERIRKITIPTVKLVHLRKVKVRNITY